MKVLAWCIDMNGIVKNIVKYPYPIGIQKREILIIDIEWEWKRDAASLTLLLTWYTKYMYCGNAILF